MSRLKIIVLLNIICFYNGAWSLSLNQYLDDVKTHNPEARSALEFVTSYESRLRESEVQNSPEAYFTFAEKDDKTPQMVPAFEGSETRFTQGVFGLRQQTEFGLNADVHFAASRTNIVGISNQFAFNNDFFSTTGGLSITQNLWRNGFGESTKANIEAQKADNDSNLLQARYHLKTVLLNAQNAYWAVVSFNQIVKLQQENVERAKRLRDRMNSRTKMRLFDDTDAIQSEAAFESRELELQSSLDDRAVQVRALNTLRGLDSDQAPEFDGLPTEEMMKDVRQNPQGHMSREDFEMLRAQAKAGLERARYAQSMIKPQFDVTAGVATNGKDGVPSAAYTQGFSQQYPVWNIGVMFSIPLDYSLIHDLRRGFEAAGHAAEQVNEQANFTEARAWDDLLKQKREAQGRFDRASSIERIQTDLVKRERRRLLDGRTTTFESLNFEQNLALAQIQRVQAQLALIRIHNALKTFEAKQ